MPLNHDGCYLSGPGVEDTRGVPNVNRLAFKVCIYPIDSSIGDADDTAIDMAHEMMFGKMLARYFVNEMLVMN